MGQGLSVTIQQDPDVADSDTATHRYLMMRVWYSSTAGVNDSSNDFNTSGDFPGNASGVSVDIDIPNSGGQGASQKIWEKKLTVAKTFGASQSIYAAAWLSGINYWGTGNQVYDNATYVVPARAWVAPDKAPTPPCTPSSTAITVNWSFPDGNGDPCDYVQVQVSRNSGFTSLVHDYNDSTSPAGPGGLAKGTTYYVRVRGHNRGGYGAWSNTVTVTTLTTVPSTPGTPSVSNIQDTTATASWSEPTDWGGDDDNQYDLEVDPGTNGFNFTGNSRGMTGLTPNTSTRCRARAQNSQGQSSYSAWRTFLTKPGKPTPPALESASPSGAILYAAPPGDGAPTIRIQVARDAAFTDIVKDQTGSSEFIELSGLTPATTYYARALASNATGNIGWSATSTFQTLAGSYIWTGSAWVNAVPYVWTGSAWKVAEAYVWRNGAWRR